MSRYLVLGLLRDGAVHHGYARMKDYAGRAGQQINTGSFYRELAATPAPTGAVSSRRKAH